ncbi:MAG: peptide chain release factor N(5)-glutamine methyltransferase, partial [Eubacteriales bacterium]|nr:peptide chain release factor N(5)-glutamine methyltransferase [Eubacteriales bacterium]
MINRHEAATVRSIRRELAGQLVLAAIDEARHEALLMVAATLELPISRLLAEPDRPVSQDEARLLHQLAKRRAAREPLAYILGRTVFSGLDFSVGPGTLIPRPDSEILVETARR